MVSSCILILLVSCATVINCKPQLSCVGVYCLPNPGNCNAVYPIGSCCPVWNCGNPNGGNFNSYGLSRVGGGPGFSYSQSSMSSSSNNGGPSSVSFSSLNRSSGATRSPGLSTLTWLVISSVTTLAFLKSVFPPGAM